MAHGVSIKLEKTRRPQLAMSGDAVELVDWDEFVFVFKFQLYKRLALSIRIGRRSAQPGQLNARVAFPTTGAGLPKAAGKPPVPKKRWRGPAYERCKKKRLAKFGPAWQSTWSFE